MRDLKRKQKAKPKTTPVERSAARPDHASLKALTREMAAYNAHLARMLREHGGQFVLIKGHDIVGFFPDRSSALEEGYRQFGFVSFLVREITDSEPVIYLPNVVP